MAVAKINRPHVMEPAENVARTQKSAEKAPITAEKLDGAQALVKTLDDLGIEYIFGYSGGAALPIFDALETVDSKIRFVLTRPTNKARRTWPTVTPARPANRRWFW